MTLALPPRPRAVRRTLWSLTLLLASAWLSNTALAKETLVDAAPVQGKKIRLDGMLKEWPQATKLSERTSGSSSSTSASGVVAYDDKHLYIAMKVSDAHLVRTQNFGTNEDHASLVIGFPRAGGGHKLYEVRLYAGKPGKSAGAVKIDGLGKVPGAQIVEAPDSDGYSFEAKLPWAVFPEAKQVRSGLRGALRYTDVDASGKKTVVATSKATGSSLPPLTIEAEYALNKALVFPKGLNPRADKELVGNVVGDKMQERIAIYDRYLTVTGWGYRKGSEFYYQDLKVLNPGDLKRFGLEDVDLDGHDDIVVHRRVGSAGDARDYFEIWHFRASDDGPQLLFQHEVGMVRGNARIENKVALDRVRGKWNITVAQGSSSDLDPDEWDGPTLSGERATLMPWESVGSRRYEWNGKEFELVEEKEGDPEMKAPKGSGTSLAPGRSDPLPDGDVPEAAPPRPPSPDELMDKVYALYRADRGVKKTKPRFDFVTNVASSEDNERILVHDQDIVVFGKKFKGGTSYVYTSIGVKEAEHILDVTARDLTGDGRAEIIVRGIIPVKASKQLGGDVVTRHALFVYRVDEDGISRVFGAETGRSLEGNAILGRVSFIPAATAMRIELRPGRSVGWSQATYPFPEDKLPYGGLEPLLLPWTEMDSRSYVYQGGEYRLVE